MNRMPWLLLLPVVLPLHAATYYVTPAGGVPPTCDGTTALPAPAAHCSWSSPLIALPPPPYGGTSTLLIKGGDTLSIADGSYMIGIGAPGTGGCNTGNAQGCTLAPLPSGPDPAHPTRIIGDVSNRDAVELWGTQRAYSLINIAGTANVEIGGMQLTDHSSCIQNQCSSGLCKGGSTQINMCQNTTYPYGPWAQNGIVGSGGSNIVIHDMDIHGLGNEGMKVGAVTNMTMDNVHVYANGFGGVDMDTSNGVTNAAYNHGAMVFSHFETSYNGCGEMYPGNVVYGCWAQNVGGYGDGLATGHTSGNWSLLDSSCHNNVQDGCDLLYGDNTATLVVERSQFYGNAGNQLKWRGLTALIQDSLFVGNCFSTWSTSYASFLFNMDLGDVCRASGSAIALSTVPNSAFTLDHDTITGGSGSLIELSQTGTDGGGANTSFTLTNSIVNGNNNQQWQLAATGGGNETVGGVYDYNVSPPAVESYTHNVFYGVKGGQCPTGSLCVDPLFTNADITAFNPLLQPSSPAMGVGSTTFSSPSCSWPAAPTTAQTCPGGTWVHGAQCPTWVYQGGICPVTAVTCTIVASVTAPSITCH
jgi:hypothetical protein